MARTSKIPRYEAFNKADNAYGPRAQDPKLWRTKLDQEIPLNLELGCGKAEVSLALAQKYSEENFIGVDLKADRLWKASVIAKDLQLDNVAFIQADILTLDEFIRPDTVKMIWLTHPDPYPKDRHAKHRMLNRNFLDQYKKALQTDGFVRFKTDNANLFAWAKEILGEQSDVMIVKRYEDLHTESHDEDLVIETNFTKKYRDKGVPIKYLEFRFI